MFQGSAVCIPVENPSQAGWSIWAGDDTPEIHSSVLHFIKHDAAKDIITAHANERGTQASGAAPAGGMLQPLVSFKCPRGRNASNQPMPATPNPLCK